MLSRWILTIASVYAVAFYVLTTREAVAQAPEFETPVAVTNVTLVPEPGTTIENATIVISDGRINAAGAEVAIPPHARRIEGKGLFAYAGFINATSHVGMPEEAPSEEEMARLQDEEQEVREGPRVAMQWANRNGVWPHRTVIDEYVANADKLAAYRKAGFTTALISPRPAILGGRGDIVQLSGKPLRAAVIQPSVTQIASFSTGSEDRSYPGSKMGIVALLRQTYLDAEWYRQRHEQALNHPAKVRHIVQDPVLDAVGDLLDRRQMWIFAVDSPNEIHHALNLADELDQRIAILGGAEAWKVADRLANEDVPVIVSVDFPEKPKLAPKKRKTDQVTLATTDSWSSEWEDDFFEPLAVRRERIREWEDQVNNLHMLLQAGVTVAITDRESKNPGDLWKNLRKALELGLTEEELLEALTTGPATILGATRELGTVAPGKLANLTILTGPVGEEDSKVRHVFIGGNQFDFAVQLGASEEEDEEGEGDEEEKTAESEETSDKSEKEEAEPEDRHPWVSESEADREPPIDTGGNLLLKNATVLTVTRGTLENTDILVVDGRIYDIGRDLQPRNGTTVIDLTGYWVMPGIIDPHSHMAVTGINENSQSITCEVRQSDVINHTQLPIHRALAGGVTTIHTMHGSANTIGGQNAVLKLKYNTSPQEMLVTSGPRIVKFALGENVTRDRRPARYPNSRMGVESVLRQAFNAGVEYDRMWQDYAEKMARGEVAELPRRDLRLEALTDILNGDIWIHSHCYRADEILRLLAVTTDFGVRVACLQHVLEGYRIAPEMYAHGVAGSTFSDRWSYKKEVYDAIPYNAAMMLREGVITSLNSDSAKVVRHMNLEAAKTLRYGGLTADEALRLITIYPAIQIGLEHRIGSIEEGKDGDFAVYTAHPLDTHTKNVLTVIEGRAFFAHRDLDLENMQPGPGLDAIPAPPRGLMDIPRSPNSTYAIMGATVHPVSDAPIENGVVLIENGRISAVGKAIEPPGTATVINAQGLHVYPGLVNAATQLGLVEISGISQTVDAYELARFQPDLKALSAINPHSEHIPVALCEGITTAHVIPGGGVISGRAAMVQLKGWTMPEMLRDGETGLVLNLPSLRANLDDDDRNERIEEHRESIEAIEAFMRRAKHYADVRSADGSRVTQDLRLEAMIPYVRGEKPVYFRASSYKEILEAVKFAETFDLKPVILGGSQAWKCADMLAEKQVPVIVTGVFDLPYNRYERWDAYYANPARLEEASVTFCIATDGAEFARQLGVHAGMAVAHGLSPERAVRSITLDAAAIMGVDGSVGSLEPGKTADVIITTGSPTQANTRTIGCFIAGVPTELTSLHEEHYRKFSNRPNPNLKPLTEANGPSPMRLTEKGS